MMSSVATEPDFTVDKFYIDFPKMLGFVYSDIVGLEGAAVLRSDQPCRRRVGAAGVSRSCASSRGEWRPPRWGASHASCQWGCRSWRRRSCALLGRRAVRDKSHVGSSRDIPVSRDMAGCRFSRWPGHPHWGFLNVFTLFAITIIKPIVSTDFLPVVCPNLNASAASLSRFATQTAATKLWTCMKKYKASYTVVSSSRA